MSERFSGLGSPRRPRARSSAARTNDELCMFAADPTLVPVVGVVFLTTGDHVLVCEHANEYESGPLAEIGRVKVRVGVAVVVKYDLGPERADGVGLEPRGGDRHDDGPTPEPLRAQCDTLGVVPGGRADHPRASWSFGRRVILLYARGA